MDGCEQLKLIDVTGKESRNESGPEVRVTVTEPADGGRLLVWPPTMQAVLRDHDQSALRQQLYKTLLSHTQTVTQLHQQAESAATLSESVETSISDRCRGAAKNSRAISAPAARCCLEHLAADLAVLQASTAAVAELMKLLD